MSYVEVRGTLPGDVDDVIRWEDGKWTGLEPALAIIEAAKGEPVSLTPTGPIVAADSARAAAYLAAIPFERVTSYETDIPLDLEPLPPGAIA